MKIISVRNNTELCDSVKAYCKENRGKVYKSFAETAESG